MFIHQFKQLFELNRKTNNHKDLLVVGNGQSVNKLDIKKISDALKSNSLDVIVVNSFFDQKKFSLPDVRGVKYFYLDTHILPVYNKSHHEVDQWLKNKIDKTKDSFERSIYSDYIAGSVNEDLRSIKTAINRKNTEVFMHPKFLVFDKTVGHQINILRYQRLSKYLAPILERVFGKFTLSNYFGGNVVGSAIMYGVDTGYKNIFVIGHMGKFDYHKTDTWKINYRYFYDEQDRWYTRYDDLQSFGYNYLNDRIKQFKLPKYIRTRVKFLGSDHDNFALMASRVETEGFFND